MHWKAGAKDFPHLAIAIKCKTAFVEPPSAMTITIALRRDFRVIISRGFKSIFSNSNMYFPAKRHSSNFNGSSAGIEELSGKKKEKKIRTTMLADANSSDQAETNFYL
jgi:hypothetical protein